MAFVTYENRWNPHVTIHVAGCSQIEKRGGEHKHGQGQYNEHAKLADAQEYAQQTELRVIECSFCKPHRQQKFEDYQDRHELLPYCNVRGPIESPRVEVDPIATGNTATSDPVPSFKESMVQFSRWCRWAERETLDEMDAAGVYALACFDEAPPSSVDVLNKQTVYIGETCDNTLTGRLAQFHRSAFLQKDGHSGGRTFSSQCAGQREKLYLAVFPVATLRGPHRSVFIRHTERRLLWEFVVRWGRRPVCNSK